MKHLSKTFYLWDMADTLFPEVWDKEKSGFESYDQYVQSLGFDLKTISGKDYEWAYKIPYETGMFNLNLAKGFKKVLKCTKHNAAFTTGNREQTDWRQTQLGKKYGIKIKDYLPEIYSTFDYGDTNKKTVEMLADILKQKFTKGYQTVVYTDDKKTNCKFFISAAKLALRKKININYRVYNIRYGLPALKQLKENFFQIGSLLQLLEQEKNYLLKRPEYAKIKR